MVNVRWKVIYLSKENIEKKNAYRLHWLYCLYVCCRWQNWQAIEANVVVVPGAASPTTAGTLSLGLLVFLAWTIETSSL